MFQEFVSISSRLSNLLAYNCSTVFVHYFFTSLRQLHFSLLFGSSLFYSWWAWLKLHQVYLFPKKQLLVSGSFLLRFLFLFFCFFPPSLPLYFSFLLFIWALFILLSLIPLDGSSVVYLSFYCFLRKTCITINFPFTITLSASCRFWNIVSILTCLKVNIFWFLLWFPHWTTAFEIAYCLVCIFSPYVFL